VALDVPVCIYADTGTYFAVTNVFPNANLVKKDERGVYAGLFDGSCDIAITTVSTWQGYQYDETINGDCNLEWIGRVFQPVQSGFALNVDSGILCTSFLRDVMNLHLEQMIGDGFVAAAWAEYGAQTATVFCDETEGDVKPSKQMTMRNMGGIFLFHGILSFSALLMAIVVWYRSEGTTDTTHNTAVNVGKTERAQQMEIVSKSDRPDDVLRI
jgi:hypothetical protein